MIHYELLTRDKYREAAEFMMNNFFVHEPFGLALGLTLNQVTRWYPEFLEKMLDSSEPVSYLAWDKEKGELAGAIINIIIDPAKPPPPSMKTFLDPQKEPVKLQIVNFLERLEDGIDICSFFNQPKSSKILDCLFLSVRGDYCGHGIAKELVEKGEMKAKEIPGVTITMTDATSAFSYKAFLKLGYQLVKEVDYLSYQDENGEFIFKDKEDKLGVHTHARVVAKVL